MITAAELEGTVTAGAELEAVGTTGATELVEADVMAGTELDGMVAEVVRFLVFAARLACAVVLLSK